MPETDQITALSPEAFRRRMERLHACILDGDEGIEDDEPGPHEYFAEMIALMCSVLRSHGYEEGVRFIDEAAKADGFVWPP